MTVIDKNGKILPDIYANVLVFGGGSPPSEGAPVAKIGGIFGLPDYGLAYLLAARFLIERGREDGYQNELAIPVAYLQRHAFELALKSLIGDAQCVKADQASLEALKVDGNAEYVKPEEVPFDHNLQDLIKRLRKALSEIEYGDVPSEFAGLAVRLEEVDRRDHTRLRYPRGRDRKESFSEQVLIPVGETQDQLERTFAKLLHRKPWSGDEGLGTQLAEELEALGQQLERLDTRPWIPIEGPMFPEGPVAVPLPKAVDVSVRAVAHGLRECDLRALEDPENEKDAVMTTRESWRIEWRRVNADWEIAGEDGDTVFASLEAAITKAQECPPTCAVSVLEVRSGARILVYGQDGRDVAGRFTRGSGRPRDLDRGRRVCVQFTANELMALDTLCALRGLSRAEILRALVVDVAVST